jgi:GTPase SAR1 family protein
MFYSFFIGPAGSGKSTLVGALYRWLNDNEIDSTIVNLDPGVLNLPYTPDVDVRDYVNIEDIILDYNLGPNGALIACADIIATKIFDIKEEIDNSNNDLILIDTPGQMELFTYRSSGPFIIEALGKEKSIIFFLIDPTLAKKPSDFASIILLSISTQFRFMVSQINLLTKTDLITKSETDRIVQWINEPNTLIESIELETKGVKRELTREIYYIIKNIGFASELLPVSINEPQSIANIYGQISRAFFGGEDGLIK